MGHGPESRTIQLGDQMSFEIFSICQPDDATVTRPFCLVESHIVKDAAKAGVLCFTSFTFCNNNSSCSLRLSERIYICINSSVSYLILIELAVMIHSVTTTVVTL